MTRPTYLYRAYDETGTLLYVGITYRLHARIRAHEADKDWWADVARVEAVKIDGREDAEEAEMKAIRTENPKWNITVPGPGGYALRRRPPKQPPAAPPVAPRRTDLPVLSTTLFEDMRLLGADEGGRVYYVDRDGMVWNRPWMPGDVDLSIPQLAEQT